uniref:Tail assembly chaperone n=2 Tax=viral metagenome TaxID=1070528 RepID=A0A6H1ZTV8_9ZZZZ
MMVKKEINILAEEKPKSITLSDGKEYKLPPIDMTTLANIEKTMGFGLGRLQTKLENETMTTMRALIYALLKEEQPELDIDKVGRLITLKEISSISGTISEIMAISS